MTQVSSKFQSLLRTGILTTLAFGTSQLCHAAGPTVRLAPGDNIQKIVASNPEGTTFLLSPGNYRGQVVNPKNNDTFTGSGGMVYLIGSELLDFAADPQGTGLFVANAPTVINQKYGTCGRSTPLCSYPQDLYIHSVPQVPVTSPKNLADGKWYFDRQTKKIYLSSDPGNNVVELGVYPYAFASMATNVTIKNLVVENYANNAQFGAIGDQDTGAGWTVQGVTARYNHGVGIKLGTRSQVLNSIISMNGELGVSVSGSNSKVVSNVITGNNYAGYSLNWEGGGSKFSETTNLLLSHNNVHDNIGPGLWCDTDNRGTIYDSNIIWNNLSAGIQHEISYDAIIRNNTIYGNGTTPGTWLWNAQISIQNSANVQVYDNKVEVTNTTSNGISIINQRRKPGRFGQHVSENNAVYNNTITYDLPVGKSGMVNDTGVLTVYNNKFYGNNYILKQGTDLAQHWAWFHYYDWKTFLSASGQESGATVTLASANAAKH